MEMLHWYVFNYDFNNKKIETINLFELNHSLKVDIYEQVMWNI